MNYAKPIIRKMVTIIFVFVILSSAFAESINIPNITVLLTTIWYTIGFFVFQYKEFLLDVEYSRL